MPTGWETYPIQYNGGLVTNLAPLQLGINKPGAARVLENFEPSVEGGYRRILGYNKFADLPVPSHGNPLVQGSGQTGTTLLVANLGSNIPAGSTINVSGVSGTYTVSASAYDASLKTATLTISPALVASPADKAAVIVSNDTSPITTLFYFQQNAVVFRGGAIWEASLGGSWTQVNTPAIGEPLVDGAAQTGTTLVMSGVTITPPVGSTFSVAGIELVYTVTAVTSLVGDVLTVVISPALNSSPADNAVVSFLSTNVSADNKARFTRYSFSNTPTVMIVDGVNPPARYSANGYEVLTGAPSDAVGAEFVAEFKSSIFYAKGTTIAFTAPLTDDNFATGDGAGVVNLSHAITGLIVFRDQLIIFCRSKIYRIVGNSFADFQLLPISLDIGCVASDSIQEVGGDVAFLGPDGVRLLGATERIGDFNFGIVSRNIQSEVTDLVARSQSICSTVIRGKNQYRLFSYSTQISRDLTRSILGTQFADQSSESGAFSWSEIVGIKVYAIDSQYTSQSEREFIIFGNDDGYVYKMEEGNSFDGVTITARFFTPYLPVNDPRVRKTFYKATTYLDPEGSVEGLLGLRYDFNNPGKIQPNTQPIQNTVTGAAVWGQAVWGSFSYSNEVKTFFDSQTTGSGFTVSLEYTFNIESPPFSLDSTMLEFKTDDRK